MKTAENYLSRFVHFEVNLIFANFDYSMAIQMLGKCKVLVYFRISRYER